MWEFPPQMRTAKAQEIPDVYKYNIIHTPCIITEMVIDVIYMQINKYVYIYICGLVKGSLTNSIENSG